MNHIRLPRVFKTLVSNDLVASGIPLSRLRSENPRNLPFHLNLGARKASDRVHVNTDLKVYEIDKFFNNVIECHGSYAFYVQT